jgi:protein TonB
LEDVAGVPQADGAPAQGVGNDLTAGSLDISDALDGPGTGAGEWERLALNTLGFGLPGGGQGRGNQAAGSGAGGGGGSNGIAGGGYGFGTLGASGSGGGGTGEGRGGSGYGRVGVEPLFMGSGEYPERARRNKQEGVVQLKLEVLADGKTGAVEVLKSSGTEDLDKAAVKAARKWRFKPVLHDGQPLAVWVEARVRYQLQDGG